MTYCTLDTETTIKTSFKRKANPFDKDNWVVTHAFKHKEGKVVEHRFGSRRPPAGWLEPVLHGTRLLVGFNVKFDILHALQDAANLKAWMTYVADGGNVWDCQLAEYLLNGMGQKDQMLSLDEVAPRYGGNVKVDEVKALWAAGVNTPDIEPSLLTRYLCGGPDENGVWQLGDVENTEKVALAQIARARACGQLNSILLNMGALLFTIEAERNGMFVEKQQGMTLAAELEVRVKELGEGLAQYLPADLPFDFNWGSPVQRSALFFGGTVQYDCRQYDLKDGTTTWDAPEGVANKADYCYAQKDVQGWLLVDDTVSFVNPFDAPDPSMYATFKGGKNAGEFKTKKVKCEDWTKPKGRIAKRPFTFAGYTKPKKSWAGADPGVWSTSSAVIEELATSGVPFLKAYAELMSMTKDLGTYYYRKDEDGKETGMLTLVNAEGIIHHMLNMCSTVTARLSSSNPNLQNIPKGNKSDVKTLFMSRFGKYITDDFGNLVYVSRGKIVQSDFSSLEVYVQAVLTQCKQLIADLKSGLDLHVVRLAAKEHMDYQEVFNLAKGYTDANGKWVDAEKEWDYKRTKAKVYSFQRAYGAGVKKIAQSTGMAEDEVQALADAEDARYPEVPLYYADVTQAIKLNAKPLRHIQHPEFPGVVCQIRESFYRTPDGKLYSYTEQPSPEYLVKKGVTASFSPTEIRNYVVQGAGGEWAKAAMWLSVRAFYQRENFGGLALLVNQVHDAEYVDADDSVAHEAACLLHACMEAASDFMEYWFDWPIPVPVPSDTSWGLSMMDEEKIPGLKERAAKLRTELRQQYMDGYVPSYLN
jgi:DNA polymerase I-like protein with 3'-5' exonuclease and polymerase domains